MQETPDTYTCIYDCDNCGKAVEIEFNHGRTADLLVMCTNCGVKAARKRAFNRPSEPDMPPPWKPLPLPRKWEKWGQGPIVTMDIKQDNEPFEAYN